LNWEPDDAELLDRFHGAWTGRCLGCALGKPVEVIGFQRDGSGRLIGRRLIRERLEATNDWPLRDYFTGRTLSGQPTLICPDSTRERIRYMEADDDIHYTLTGIGILEKNGFGFSWKDVAAYWTDNIPVGSICTAEIQALLNVLNRAVRFRIPETELDISEIRRFWNPYREWIGAQIRSDGWAWACAGHPEKAAELAWRDASWTHERNGIYGEMFMAAIQAAAFVVDDPLELIRIGLSEIPRDCRLAKAVRMAVEWKEQAADFEEAMDLLEADPVLNALDPVHTINNAVVCVTALLFGGMDLDRTASLAVSGGLDTDCNGASTGSVVGAAIGRRRYTGNLAGPLRDRIRPRMPEFHDLTLKELAERTLALWREGKHV
jgi:ADP-ribosylglycohydrolase